jgi:hypothetical protein
MYTKALLVTLSVLALSLMVVTPVAAAPAAHAPTWHWVVRGETLFSGSTMSARGPLLRPTGSPTRIGSMSGSGSTSPPGNPITGRTGVAHITQCDAGIPSCALAARTA